ncbi:phosphoribosylanthranilate isomerase [Moraxella nasovis]|uniref:phosphoribosylanthranilate isomerase n=1 Tax=Moraxella nasovis TaxID=2904121 RepID=UPI001F625BF7|nr:phosphoribosylanthranilate isomerase [Moraxella nasovis]UNU72878.1 phosphoribosylanthranilate isomerase [Moraxella nasovis]
MTAVKFCGFTHADDLQIAVSLGVDAVGLVFYPSSPRYVTSKQASELVKDIPAFTTIVALVVNMSEQELVSLAHQVSFDIVQFHGDETPSLCQALANTIHKRWIKALRIKDTDTSETILKQIQTLKDYGASGVLLDAYQADKFGGTGERFDWDKIPKNSPLPIILAGGLTADNVGQATKNVGVYGVDVSGGIEWQKGRKCREKMAKFLQNIR